MTSSAPGGHSSLDIDQLRLWIGRQEVVADTVTTELVRRFNATFDIENGAMAPGDLAPPLIHFCLAQPAVTTGALGEDGHPRRGGFLPPVPLPRRMWASSRILFSGDLRIGDVVTRTSTIQDITVKAGKSGTLCFVVVAHDYDVGGAVVITELQTIVYRGASSAQPPAATPAAPEPVVTHAKSITPSTALLFRYSALTFNGHRIHYDLPYTTEVEGYPGLVVHGPLQATLLLLFACDIKGARPTRFEFTAKAPIFGGEAATLNARIDGADARFWTAREGGAPAMEAVARWG